MKVGIVTFHNAYSFGAACQCYALQKYLNNKGYETEIIDYSMEGFREKRKSQGISFWLSKILKVLKHPCQRVSLFINERKNRKKQAEFALNIQKRNKQFQDFWNKEYKTNGVAYPTYSSIRENRPFYDAYICGSDQIWNPNFSDMDDTYYLQFAPVEKRIAYAPSIGGGMTQRQMSEISRRISDIPYVSLREADDQLAEMAKKAIPKVLDPTLLLDRNDWCHFASKSDLKIDEEYVLTYFIGDDEYIRGYINDVRDKFTGCKIINLVFNYCEYGPYDFVNLILNSRFVFTNSYHGMLISMNLNKPFAIGMSTKDFGFTAAFGRMESILQEFGMTDRIVKRPGELKRLSASVDFTEMNKNRSKLQKESEDFLLGALEDIKRKENV